MPPKKGKPPAKKPVEEVADDLEELEIEERGRSSSSTSSKQATQAPPRRQSEYQQPAGRGGPPGMAARGGPPGISAPPGMSGPPGMGRGRGTPVAAKQPAPAPQPAPQPTKGKKKEPEPEPEEEEAKDDGAEEGGEEDGGEGEGEGGEGEGGEEEAEKEKEGGEEDETEPVVEEKKKKREEKKEEKWEKLPHVSRPEIGKLGTPVALTANYFQMRFGGQTAFQYDVKIAPEMKSKAVMRKIVIEASKKEPLKGFNPAYDGQALMYSNKPLKFKEWPITIQVPEASLDGDEGRPPPAAKPGGKPKREPRIFTVSIRPSAQSGGTGQLDMDSLIAYSSGKSKELPRSALQALDVVMRYNNSILHHPIGRAVFYPSDPEYQSPLSGGAQLWFGHYQSVRATQGGLMLNVDMAATVMVQPSPVLEYVCARLNRRHPNDIQFPGDLNHVSRALKGLRVEITHRGKLRRKYRIFGIAKGPASKDLFEREGKKISVAQYFEEKYKMKLKFPHFPCLMVGNPNKPNSLPMEVCKLIIGQRVKHQLNSQQRQRMIEETCLNPHDRLDMIYSGCPDPSQDPYVSEFKIQLNKTMVQVKGRILPPPALAYKDEKTGKPSIVRPRNGTWSLKDTAFLSGAQVKNCPVIIWGPETRMNTRAAMEWFGRFTKTCQFKGLRWAGQPKPIHANPNPAGIKALFDNLAKQKDIQIIFCFLASAKEHCYRLIKKECETRLGVPSQCVDWEKVMNSRTGGTAYQANVGMKMNAKLGGSNTAISPKLPLVSESPTIVLGADVHHPPVGNQHSCSIAAILGSYDIAASRYSTIIQEQGHRVEHISGMEAAAKELIQNFEKKNKVLPANVIMFRDGVGEGGFDEIMSREVKAIYNACLTIKAGYRPKVTFLIVQKRNHTRLFPDQQGGDKEGRLLAGTVVDTTICSPHDFDFFLCSHAGLKGTSKPTHYHVLYDEAKFPTDQLVRLSFDLCHVYARCTRSVSIPAPAYYAHLAAYRARLYSDDPSEDSGSELSGSSGDKSGALPQVHDNLRNILYYV